MPSEKIRCNICEVVLETDDVEKHLSLPSHLSLKKNLDDNLRSVQSEDKPDSGSDSSVHHWEKSIQK